MIVSNYSRVAQVGIMFWDTVLPNYFITFAPHYLREEKLIVSMPLLTMWNHISTTCTITSIHIKIRMYVAPECWFQTLPALVTKTYLLSHWLNLVCVLHCRVFFWHSARWHTGWASQCRCDASVTTPSRFSGTNQPSWHHQTTAGGPLAGQSIQDTCGTTVPGPSRKGWLWSWFHVML